MDIPKTKWATWSCLVAFSFAVPTRNAGFWCSGLFIKHNVSRYIMRFVESNVASLILGSLLWFVEGKICSLINITLNIYHVFVLGGTDWLVYLDFLDTTTKISECHTFYFVWSLSFIAKDWNNRSLWRGLLFILRVTWWEVLRSMRNMYSHDLYKKIWKHLFFKPTITVNMKFHV